MRQLTALDANFLNAEGGGTLTHIAGLAVLDPTTRPGNRLTCADLARLVAERASLAAPLRQRLVSVPLGLDRPYWADDPDFDPAWHISEVGLPAPGDDAQLAETVALLHERELDRSRPLWEAVIIQGLLGGRVAVYAKVHHAATDGVLAADILAALLDLSPEPRPVPEAGAEPVPAPSPAAMVSAGLTRSVFHPVAAARSLAQAAPYLDEVPLLGQLPGARRVARALQEALGRDPLPPGPRLVAPPTPFNGPVGRRRSVAFGSLPLAEVKRARGALGGSVNDVVMALCAAALRRWLDKRGRLPDVPLVAAVPASLRRRSAAADGANQVSVMLAQLPTHLDDPAERFTAMRQGMAAAKRRFAVTGGGWLDALSQLAPVPLSGPLVRLAMRTGSVRPINLMVSNVPGPQFPLYLCGARVLAYHPVSVVSDLTGGINITVFSYDGRLDIGIVACRDMVPDPGELIDHLDDALDELKGLLEP
ncbi:wax ester/triacylglycerol synthase family O-acyltransferase [Actinomadura craniellae]|uniref:Diacylglycerol O-acyltransferase n=1 Tax=Actinomadura craniellae TaxID=2231787 RepID=A0A365HA12_9ACTN|nr:wax ester/triacylglycerol synthase family O-acyltransferase [Actinomadura craniellae]RAY15852.1 wax ester/triacylglycerol synthase family O-acyltransferase [Actinomadura craniellae]